MGLLNPSPGNLADRISILILKIVQAKKNGVDYVHFQSECEQCRQIRERLVSALLAFDREKYAELESRLSKVNSGLWSAEDRIRQVIKGNKAAEIIVACAVRIVTLNDERAALIHKIDGLFGEARMEKIYSTRCVT